MVARGVCKSSFGFSVSIRPPSLRTSTVPVKRAIVRTGPGTNAEDLNA